MTNTATPIYPKRCPFCRSVKVKVMFREPYPFDRRSGYVRCLDCNARGPLYRFHRDEPTNEYPIIRLWNRMRDDIGDLPLFGGAKK